MSARILAWALWAGLARKAAQLIVDDVRNHADDPVDQRITVVGSALMIVFVLAAAVTIALVTL
jgi:hypothetical protein